MREYAAVKLAHIGQYRLLAEHPLESQRDDKVLDLVTEAESLFRRPLFKELGCNSIERRRKSFRTCFQKVEVEGFRPIVFQPGFIDTRRYLAHQSQWRK